MPTNNYSKNMVYLSKEQYQELITNETITVNGQTIEYNDNDIYVIPQTEPVTNVKVNGTSVVQDGVANVPIASNSELGLVKIQTSYGLSIDANGVLATRQAADSVIKAGENSYAPIVPSNQHRSVFYGLARVAGANMSSSSNPVGTYTDTAKQKIQNMLGITDLLSTEEAATATVAHALNSLFLMGGKLYKATAAVAIGDAVVEGENCQVVKADQVFPHDVQVNGTSVMSNGVANIPIATSNSLGVVKGGGGITVGQTGALSIYKAGPNGIKSGTLDYDAIVPANQHQSVFYGLAKVAGADEKDSELPVGTYSDNAKTAIRSLIGAAAASDVTVSDVQVNGTSVLSNGVANIPKANSSNLGVIKTGGMGIAVNGNNGEIYTVKATSNQTKAGTANYTPIVPSNQHESTFYGLAKAAGADEKDSTLSVGTYTETAKTAIRNMLGAASTNIVAVQDEQPTDTDTKVWLPGTQATGIQIPTMEDMDNYVQKTDYATNTTAGIVFTEETAGLGITATGKLFVSMAAENLIKAGSSQMRPIVPVNQHQAVFYGLAKAAGDTTQSASSNAAGVYTTEAKDKIQHMIGIDSYFASYEADTTSDQLYNIGDRFIMNGLLYEATDTIALGATIIPNTNCENILLGEEFIRKSELITAINQTYSGIKVADYTTTEDLTTITIDTDLNGLPFKLRNMQLIVNMPPTTTATRSYFLAYYGTKQINSTNINMLNFTTQQTVTPADTAWSVFKYEAQCYGAYTSNLSAVRASSSTSLGTGSANSGSGTYFNYISADYIVSARLTQYNSTSSLIPAGTRFIIYGVPILE